MEQAVEKDSTKPAKTGEKSSRPVVRENPTGTTDTNPSSKIPSGAANLDSKTTASNETTAKPSGNPLEDREKPARPADTAKSKVTVPENDNQHAEKAVNVTTQPHSDSQPLSSKQGQQPATTKNPAEAAAHSQTGETTQTGMEGNDRVTGDGPPNQPLTAQATAASAIAQTSATETIKPTDIVDAKQGPKQSASIQPNAAPTTTASMLQQRTDTAKPSASVQILPTSQADPSNTLPVSQIGLPYYEHAAQQAVKDAAIDALRRPLTNLYGSYLCKSRDRSLHDARDRLKKAISQTRELRQAFTDRVYEKYRVCLKPPPTTEDILARISADPEGQVRRLKEEAEALRAEKEIEKREAAKLNEEMAASTSGERVSVLPNVDNAEQVMLFMAGLNLVILPEDEADPEDLRSYTDRAPIDHITGQRSRNLSQAAAMSGEVILDRTRKAAAVRAERKRRRQLKLLRGEAADDADTDNNYSRLQILSAATPLSTLLSTAVVSKPTKGSGKASEPKEAPATQVSAVQSSKSSRSRAQTTLSTSVLLSLHATADEVKPDRKPKAATVALMTRGIGSSSMSTQQRLKHPHPESLGGRRRASINQTKKDPNSSTPPEPFQQAFLANTLPPLPASKERTERKPLMVEPFDRSRKNAVQQSVRNILQQFVQTQKEAKLQSVQKLSFLNTVRQLKESSDVDSSAPNSSSVDPAVTVSVLHAVGLISQTQEGSSQRSSFKISNQVTENKALYTRRFKSLCSEIGSNSRLTTTNLFFGSVDQIRKREQPEDQSETSSKKARFEEQSDTQPSLDSVPVENIRGGGEVLVDTKDSKPNAKTSDNGQASESREKEESKPKKRTRSDSSPETLSSPAEAPKPDDAVPKKAAPEQPRHPSGSTPLEQYHAGAAANAYHLAAQLGHMHHPAAGDLAAYLGGFQQQHGYAIPGLISNTTQAQLSAMGFGQQSGGPMGYGLQDGAAAARAMLLREQQAAALLGYQPPAGFAHVAPHAAAMSAFLGVQGDPTMLGRAQAAAPDNLSKSSFRTKQVDSNKSSAETKNPGRKHTPESRPQKRPRASSDPKATSSQSSEMKSESNVATVDEPHGMKFTVPPSPETLSSTSAELIRSGRFHLVVKKFDSAEKFVALDYLVSLGSAVPIPKGLVLGPLQERLNTPGFKNPGNNGAPQITRDVVAATVLVWLWNNYQQSFKQAFRKSGRMDVDQTCKWLMQAAIDSAVGELALEIANLMAKGEGAFAEATAAARNAPPPQGEGPTTVSSSPVSSKTVDVCTASVVSRALNARLEIDGDLNSIFPKYQQFVELLDSTRLGSLRAKSQERTLLANLIARKSAMTENFANAYVSSMVRAGEALGHARLFETVQDEPSSASTMLPHDIFSDESGSWEDPCKPDDGFTKDLTGDELYRRAYARAMIQKSQRKLQDKHQIRGGTNTYGPFVDPADAIVTREGYLDRGQPLPSPRYGGGRRRASSLTESIIPGTGSAPAASLTTYEPAHFCSPLDWDVDDEGNTPYGVHSKLRRKQSLSLSGKTAAKNKARSMSLPMSQGPEDEVRSTNEIDWKQVASIFQSVELPQKATRARSKSSQDHETVAPNGPIVAPLCREIQGELSSGESDSDTEQEDLSEESILARHQVVLDEMKGKLDAFLAARKKQQDRRKGRTSKG